MKKVIAVSQRMKKGIFDDDYTLYNTGEILHEYDNNSYPGGYNLSKSLTVDQISIDIKERLLSAASEENKDLVRKVLGMS